MNTAVRGTYYPFALTVSVSHQNHGANTATRNFGGDIQAPVSDLDKAEDYPLLDGQLQRTLRAGAVLECEVLPGLRLYTQSTSVQVKGQGTGWNGSPALAGTCNTCYEHPG